MFSEFLTAYLEMVDPRVLLTLVILIAADLALGVTVAIAAGEFSFQKLANFIDTKVLFYLAGYLVLGFTCLVLPDLKTTLIASAAAIVISLTAGILAKLAKLGLPIPEVLVK